MKKIILFFLFFTVNLSASQLKIAVSIFPIASLTKEVIGDKGEVVTILPPGASPHFYDPSPRDILKLRDSDLFVFVGKGVEPWAFKLIDAMSKIDTIELASFIEPKKNNFHFWLDPVLMINFINHLTKKVCKIDKKDCNYYKSNGEKTILRLKKLDKDFSDSLSEIKNKNIIILHNAWFYMAKRYGLNIVATIYQSGQSISPKEIVTIKNIAKKHNINYFYGETTSNMENIKRISNILGLNYILLDPLGNSHIKTRNGYFKFMRFNLSQLMKGLK